MFASCRWPAARRHVDVLIFARFLATKRAIDMGCSYQGIHLPEIFPVGYPHWMRINTCQTSCCDGGTYMHAQKRS